MVTLLLVRNIALYITIKQIEDLIQLLRNIHNLKQFILQAFIYFHSFSLRGIFITFKMSSVYVLLNQT